MNEIKSIFEASVDPQPITLDISGTSIKPMPIMPQ